MLIGTAEVSWLIRSRNILIFCYENIIYELSVSIKDKVLILSLDFVCVLCAKGNSPW